MDGGGAAEAALLKTRSPRVAVGMVTRRSNAGACESVGGIVIRRGLWRGNSICGLFYIIALHKIFSYQTGLNGISLLPFDLLSQSLSFLVEDFCG